MLSNYEDLALPSGAERLGDEMYGDDQAYCAVDIEPSGDGLSTYVVPSTWLPGEEGIFTLSVMSAGEVTLEEVEEFEGNLLKLRGEWTSKNEGPRSKKVGKEDGKNFKPEKTWNKNPQYRVWLRDPDTEAAFESVGLAITLSSPIEEAELGMHIMRNAFCQFYNEKIEVLADRYQKVAGICNHSVTNEVTFDIQLEDSFEVKKNGCESNFPFFIVPSLMDKKMAGP